MKIEFNYRKKTYHEDLDESAVQNYLAFEKINISQAFSRSLEKIKYKSFYINRSITNNRINHNLTNLPKELLQILKMNNEPLIEFDLKCSQPLILANLIHNTISNQQHVCSDQHFQHFWITHGPTLLCSHSETNDVEKFITLARTGK